jgi:hypothetical protein
VDGSRTHARHRRSLGEALLFDEELKGLETPPASRNLEHAGLLAIGIKHWPHVEALQQAAAGDVGGKFLDRDAGLHAPDV